MIEFLFGAYLYSMLGGCGEWAKGPYPLALAFQRHDLYPECDYGSDEAEWVAFETGADMVFVSGVMLITQQGPGICGFRVWAHHRDDEAWPDCQVVSASVGGERSVCATWAPVTNGAAWFKWKRDGDAICSVGLNLKAQAIR